MTDSGGFVIVTGRQAKTRNGQTEAANTDATIQGCCPYCLHAIGSHWWV